MTGFMPDLEQHYAVAAQIPAQARLIGSVTMATGLDMFSDEDSLDQGDAGGEPSQYWVIVDSTGRLQGRLGSVRAFPPVRDVIVLVSHATPDSYLQHLAQAGVPYLMAGDAHVDLQDALRQLAEHWSVTEVVVDSGPTLTSVLLSQHLVDEVSLLLHPVVVGAPGAALFGEVRGPVGMRLESCQTARGGTVSLRYTTPDDAPTT